MGLHDIVEGLRTAIGPQVPIRFTRKEDEKNVSPPIYTIYPQTDRFANPDGPGASANPRALHSRLIQCRIKCWGQDFGQAELLMNAMITALRAVLAGRNYELGDTDWTDTEIAGDGYCVTIPVTIRSVAAEQVLPLAADGTTAVGGDNKYTTVRPTQLAFDHDAPLTPGNIYAGQG